MQGSHIATAAEHLQDVGWPELRKTEIPGIEAGDCMLVCAGFEDRAIQGLLRVRQSDRRNFSLGVVKYRPSFPQNKLERILEIGRSARLETREFLYDHEASTLDYRETLKILIEKYRERSMFDRLVVAPTGSKMQAVAVALFRAALYDVQVVYPTPQIFTEPDRYTVGARRLYELDLPIQEIRRILS